MSEQEPRLTTDMRIACISGNTGKRKMATIALYADKVNQMPGLIGDVKRSVMDFKAELVALKN